MKQWTYRGRLILPSATAEIPALYWPDSRFSKEVQLALSRLGPWEGRLGTVTVRLQDTIPMTVVPVSGRPVYWGVHVMHKARNPRPSPFVRCMHVDRTRFLSVMVAGTIDNFEVVQVAPGKVLPPPLPWQSSALGFEQECKEFWRTHAYPYFRHLVRPGTLVLP